MKDKEIILSTTPSLDGYNITEYIDVISAETIYKLSLSKSVTAAISNVIDSWKIFSSNELRGTTELICEAKEYIKNELIKKAVALHADAVVGIDIESSFSSSDGFAKVSINGTAVKISKTSTAVANEDTQINHLKTNIFTPFRPVSLILNRNINSAAINILESSEERVSDILADLSIKTIFNEEFSIDNIYFHSFSEESRKHLLSDFTSISLPQDCFYRIASCTIIVKKYVLNDQMFSVESTDLEESVEDISTEQPAEEKLDAESYIKNIFPVIKNMETAKEIYDYLSDCNEQNNQFINPLLFEQLKNSVQIERIYGNSPDSAIKKIKEFFNL